MTETQHVKLVFECNIGEIDKDGQDEYRIETMWAIPIGKSFKLDNVPFYAMGVSRGDIVSAEKEDGDSKEEWGYEEACLGFEEDDETYSNHSFGTSSPSA